jgi:hypothetical protein
VAPVNVDALAARHAERDVGSRVQSALPAQLDLVPLTGLPVQRAVLAHPELGAPSKILDVDLVRGVDDPERGDPPEGPLLHPEPPAVVPEDRDLGRDRRPVPLHHPEGADEVVNRDPIPRERPVEVRLGGGWRRPKKRR